MKKLDASDVFLIFALVLTLVTIGAVLHTLKTFQNHILTLK